MPAPLIAMLQRSRRLTSPVTTTATARSSTSGPLQRSRRLTSPVTGSERVRQQPPDASTEPETYVSGDLSQENKDAWRQVASTEPETYVSGDPEGERAHIACDWPLQRSRRLTSPVTACLKRLDFPGVSQRNARAPAPVPLCTPHLIAIS